MLTPRLFSDKYTVKRIDSSNLEDLFSLCSENKLFYKFCPPFVTRESLIEDMKALPKGKGIEDKYYVGFFSSSQLIAVLDLIDKYPSPKTAFIGFFMTDVSFQHKGTGSEIIEDLIKYLKSLSYTSLFLGRAEGNFQSESFWHKNGFKETGNFYETCGYKVILEKRDL